MNSMQAVLAEHIMEHGTVVEVVEAFFGAMNLAIFTLDQPFIQDEKEYWTGFASAHMLAQPEEYLQHNYGVELSQSRGAEAILNDLWHRFLFLKVLDMFLIVCALAKLLEFLLDANNIPDRNFQSAFFKLQRACCRSYVATAG